ncbi:YafY family protein [Brevibacillus laterosporus]|uniref:helix-turn-helix transcriptional regulator n=1 Tax=Brevibacillus laterosporus TaxID=1465 RepID=UPI0003722F2C|nr:YafY family protein [Brevibacillus laterosporus]ATO48243.1 transcriptional regulator [Brevibacillus laterosporus DSM 25]MBG9804365.1 transcriptional regulator [Brevibacillus laterosporus]MED2004679.1 YafY family protein [Brevibacillus laterosporus]MED4764537.1 YafY family protein [Brevibacillus laterosporus]TPH12641.1 YafY family transcriptional regulator [Brevibacillus laterosporus]
MKIDRLLSIIIILLNRNLVQAKDLAEQFEVSIRTIYRDIETINQAGIPIVTYQGANGGIGLAQGYRLDRQLLTNNELATIVTSLQSLSTMDKSESHQFLVEKITSIIPHSQKEQFLWKTQQFLVDLSPWGQNERLEESILIIRQAIEASHLVSFTYSNAQGKQSDRNVEPHILLVKGRSWYLYGFCKNKLDFRLFKLYRMKRLNVLDTTFTRRNIEVDELPWVQKWNDPTQMVHLVLRFAPDSRHLAEEYFGVEELCDQAGGYVTVSASFPEDNWLYGFILSFGPSVEVIEPESIKVKIKKLATAIVEKYV